MLTWDSPHVVEGLDDLDLDEDFDPDDHDRVMAKIFSQTFYADDVCMLHISLTE